LNITNAVFDRFTIGFSEDMSPATVNSSASYELRSAGIDGTFDDADDVLYTVGTNPAYSSGLVASLRVTDGPLQPGLYRFTANNNLKDRAGNALASPFTRTFTVAAVGPLTLEKRRNHAPAARTP